MFNISFTGETAINRTESYDANNAKNDDDGALWIEMGIGMGIEMGRSFVNRSRRCRCGSQVCLQGSGRTGN